MHACMYVCMQVYIDRVEIILPPCYDRIRHMYVCMYINVHEHVHAHTPTDLYIQACAHTPTDFYISMCTHTPTDLGWQKVIGP